MSNNDTNLVLDVMQSPSAKILLSTGLSINGDAEIVVLNFLQVAPGAANNEYQHVVARIAVTPTHLKAYVQMMQDALNKMEQTRNTENKE